MLSVQNLSFKYDGTPVLKRISFNVQAGEHISVIGESGSGKSTLLKLIYGEYDLDEGQIFWKDTEILGPKFNLVVGYEFMKYVAQEFDLMPFITVGDNVGKHLSNFFPEKKKQRVQELLEVVELEDFANVKVKTLSGGQKQRVALARALAKKPEILLLDEPFSHIDNFKKQSLRRNLFNYLKEQQIACIVATHDSEDVLGYADRMIVLDNASIVANDSSEHLYNNPNTPLVASFFGEFNSINGELIYAHQLKLIEKSDLKVTINHSYFKGDYYLIEAFLNDEKVFFKHSEALTKGNIVFLEKQL